MPTANQLTAALRGMSDEDQSKYLEELRYLNRIDRQTQLASQGAPMADRILDASVKDYQSKASSGQFDTDTYQSDHSYEQAYENGIGGMSAAEASQAHRDSAKRILGTGTPYSYTDDWNSWKKYTTAQRKYENWFSGSAPTYGESLAYIADVGNTDRVAADAWFKDLETMRSTPGHPFYSPYNKGSTIEGAKEFFGLDSFSKDWIRQNQGLLQYLKTSDVTGNVNQPGKSASQAEQAAYWYYKVVGQQEITEKSKDEWSAMQKTIKWYVDAGFGDAEIIQKLTDDPSNYKTLNAIYEESQRGTAAQLTEGIGYSPDAIRGVIWLARNGEPVGDPYKDYTTEIARYYRGIDRERASTTDPKDDPASDDFDPYRRATNPQLIDIGVQAGDESTLAAMKRMYAGKQELLDYYKAEEKTKLAESELALLTKRVDQIIQKSTNPEAAINAFHKLFDNGEPGWDAYTASSVTTKFNTLQGMEDKRLLGFYETLNRPVEFRVDDMEAYIRTQVQNNNLKNLAAQGDPDAVDQIRAQEAANVDPNDTLQTSTVYDKSSVDSFFDTVDAAYRLQGQGNQTLMQGADAAGWTLQSKINAFKDDVFDAAFRTWDRMVGQKPAEKPVVTDFAKQLVGEEPKRVDSEPVMSKSKAKTPPSDSPYLDLNALGNPTVPTVVTNPSGFGVTVQDVELQAPAQPFTEAPNAPAIVSSPAPTLAPTPTSPPSIGPLKPPAATAPTPRPPVTPTPGKPPRRSNEILVQDGIRDANADAVREILEGMSAEEIRDSGIYNQIARIPKDVEELAEIKAEYAPNYGSRIRDAIEAEDYAEAVKWEAAALSEYDKLNDQQMLVVFDTLSKMDPRDIDADPALKASMDQLEVAMSEAMDLTPGTNEQQSGMQNFIDNMLFGGNLKSIQDNEGVGFWTAAGHTTVQGLASFESGIAKGLRWLYDATYAPFSLIPGAGPVESSPIHKLLTTWAEHRDDMNARSSAFMYENATPLELVGSKVGSTLVNMAASAYTGQLLNSANMLAQGVTYASGLGGTVGSVAMPVGSLTTLGKAAALKKASNFFSMAGFTAQSAGTAAYESEQRGENLFTQTLLGLTSGAVTYLTEKASLGNLLDKFTFGGSDKIVSTLTQQGTTFVGRWGKAGLQMLSDMVIGGAKEGLQEVTESVVNDLSTFAVNKKAFMDGDPAQYLKGLGTEAIYGFMSGMLFNVAGFPADARSARLVNQQIKNNDLEFSKFAEGFVKAYTEDLQDPDIVSKAEELQVQQAAEIATGNAVAEGALESVIDDKAQAQQFQLQVDLTTAQESLNELKAKAEQGSKDVFTAMQDFLANPSDSQAQKRFSDIKAAAQGLVEQVTSQEGIVQNIKSQLDTMRTNFDTAIQKRFEEIRAESLAKARAEQMQQKIRARATEAVDRLRTDAQTFATGLKAEATQALQPILDEFNAQTQGVQALLDKAIQNPNDMEVQDVLSSFLVNAEEWKKQSIDAKVQEFADKIKNYAVTLVQDAQNQNTFEFKNNAAVGQLTDRLEGYKQQVVEGVRRQIDELVESLSKTSAEIYGAIGGTIESTINIEGSPIVEDLRTWAEGLREADYMGQFTERAEEVWGAVEADIQAYAQEQQQQIDIDSRAQDIRKSMYDAAGNLVKTGNKALEFAKQKLLNSAQQAYDDSVAGLENVKSMFPDKPELEAFWNSQIELTKLNLEYIQSMYANQVAEQKKKAGAAQRKAESAPQLPMQVEGKQTGNGEAVNAPASEVPTAIVAPPEKAISAEGKPASVSDASLDQQQYQQQSRDIRKARSNLLYRLEAEYKKLDQLRDEAFLARRQYQKDRLPESRAVLDQAAGKARSTQVIISKINKEISVADKKLLELDNARGVQNITEDDWNRPKPATIGASKKEDLREFARRVMTERKSRYGIEKFVSKLESLLEPTDGSGSVNFNKIARAVSNLAVEVLDRSVATDSTLREQYKDMRDYFRNNSFVLNQQQKTEAGNAYDGYQNFRRMLFGSFHLKNIGKNLDSVWGEISERWPEFFDPNTPSPEQPLAVARALESIKPVRGNPYANDITGHAAELAREIMDWFSGNRENPTQEQDAPAQPSRNIAMDVPQITDELITTLDETTPLTQDPSPERGEVTENTLVSEDGRPLRQFNAQTVQNNPVVSDEAKAEAMGDAPYDPDSNARQEAWAKSEMNARGYEQTVSDLLTREGPLDAQSVLLAQVAIYESISRGDGETETALVLKVGREGTAAGQILQARSAFNRRSPVGAAAHVAGTADKSATDLFQKKPNTKVKVESEGKGVAERAAKAAGTVPANKIDNGKNDGGNNQWGTPLTQGQWDLIDQYGLNNVKGPGLHYNRATIKERMLEAILLSKGVSYKTLGQQLAALSNGIPVATLADFTYIKDRLQEFLDAGGEVNGQMTRAASIALTRVNEAAHNIDPVSFDRKAEIYRKSGMLLNARTFLRNIFGNASNVFTEGPARMLSAPIDAVVSKVTGQRTISLGSAQDYVNNWKGFVEELGRTIVDTWVNQVDTSQGNRFGMYGGRVYQNNVGETIQQLSNFLLSVGDRPFWKRSYLRSMAEQQRLNASDEITMPMHEKAVQDANYTTFQEDNKLADWIQNGKRNLGKAGFLIDLAIPFVKIPTNLAKRMMEYSPVGIGKAIAIDLIAPAIRNDGSFNQETFVKSLSRGLTGIGLNAVGYCLAAAGIIKMGYRDEDDPDKAQIERAQGKPYTMYLDFGSTNADITWLSPVAFPIAFGATWRNIEESAEESGKGLGSVMWAGIASMGNALFDQSFMSSISDMLMGSGTPFENAMSGLAEAFVGQNIPALVRQTATAMDPYVRDTRDKNILMDMLKSTLIASLPVWRETLPEKVDVTGNPFRAHAFNSFLESYWIPAALESDRNDAALQELLELNARTGETGFLPGDMLPGATNTLTNGARSLTDKEKEQFKRLAGTTLFDGGTVPSKGSTVRLQGLRSMFKSEAYQRADDAQRMAMISAQNEDARAGTREQFLNVVGRKEKDEQTGYTPRALGSVPEYFASRPNTETMQILSGLYEKTGDASYMPTELNSTFSRNRVSYTVPPEGLDEYYALYENYLEQRIVSMSDYLNDPDIPEEERAQKALNLIAAAKTAAGNEWVFNNPGM